MLTKSKLPQGYRTADASDHAISIDRDAQAAGIEIWHGRRNPLLDPTPERRAIPGLSR